MSTSPFPAPRTLQFNPSAWDFRIYFKYLNSILTYPRAQLSTMNFPNLFLTTRTTLTQWADTAYATSEISAWIAANVNFGIAQVWAVLQYYFGGIAVATINPLTTGGTLLIGNGSTTNIVEVHSIAGRSAVLRFGTGNTSAGGIHINNGTNTTGDVNILTGTSTGTLTLGNQVLSPATVSTTNLNCPLTPLYSYPITGNQIGRIYDGTVLTLNVGGAGTQVSVMTVTIPVGVYLFSASANVDPTTAKTVFHFFDGTTISGTGEQCSYYPGGLPLHYVQSTAISHAVAGTVRWRMLCRPVAIVLQNARFQAIRIG